MGFGVVFAEGKLESDRFAGKVRVPIFGVVKNDDIGVHQAPFGLVVGDFEMEKDIDDVGAFLVRFVVTQVFETLVVCLNCGGGDSVVEFLNL